MLNSTRGRKIAAVAVVSLLMIPMTAAAAPFTGTYLSTGLGGDMLEGRWSESFVGADPGHGNVGNSIHAESWDGSTLGTDWELTGPALQSTTLLIEDIDPSGDGFRLYETIYNTTAATLALTDQGDWWNPADGSGQYTVDLDEYTHKTIYEFDDGDLAGIRTEVRLDGTFVGEPGYAVEFLIALAVPVGEGDTLPSDYPDWAPGAATTGHWGNAQEIEMKIVPEPATLTLLGCGAVALIRRRRR